MNTFTKCSISLVTWSAMLINQVQAYLPPITFENPGYVALQSVGAVPGTGWSLISGKAAVSPAGTGFGGGQALKLEADSQQEPFLKREIDWDAAETTAFLDLQLKPAADPEGSLASFYANGTQLAFQVPSGGDTGEIWVYHGSTGEESPAQWAKTVGTFALAGNGLTASGYTRITLRHDYQRNIWDLFINGKIAAANLAFEGRGSNLENIELYGSKTGDTLIDDLSANPDNMLFPDADKDGLPDAWEIANGSNPNLYDRDEIKPGTNSSFLDLYMDSLWSGGLNGSAPLPPQGSIPPITILGGHQPVTSLKGSLSVGGDGSSSYSIPIDIPKGTAGMEPKVSLTYSSSGGNGIVGLGWSIGGLQSITRGTASVAKDGFAGTVNFDGNDRFFFNGERLVCITGNYGGENSEYRTEIDSFARFTLKGGDQKSPNSWWSVETKAGLIIELGNTADSKVSAPVVDAPMVWDVSKVADTAGNYYLVHWADTRAGDNTTLDNRRLDRISYTGTSGFAPYCDLQFGYESRPDSSFAYSPQGLRSTNGIRLESITVKTSSQLNHTYFLDYDTSNQSSRSLLKYVYKQQADGSTTAPTVFDWDGLKAGNPRWAKVANGGLPVYGGTSLDANNSSVNSLVTTDGTSVRLEGDVARYQTVPGNINVATGSFIEFEFRAKNLDNGAFLCLDRDGTLDAEVWSQRVSWGRASRMVTNVNPDQFMVRIKPTGASTSEIFSRREVTYGTTADTWQTFRISFQGDSNANLNLSSGSFANLALLNVDNNPANDTGYAEFRNIRVGTAAQLDANQVSPITFPETFDIPRFTVANGASRGTQIIDLDSDGLPDLIDLKAEGWEWSGNELVPKSANISGTAYRNTGKGFCSAPELLPDPRYSPVNVGGGGDWITRFDLNAVPCDVNSDGQLDLFVTELKKGDPGATSTQRYKFITRIDGVWTELTDYKTDFESRTTAGWSGAYPGAKHLVSKDLIDMDRDGYADLVIETQAQAKLVIPMTETVIVAPASRTVFLNRCHLGLGWVQHDNFAPPLPLRRTDGATLFDIGNRLVDINGDGFTDQISATLEYGYLTCDSQRKSSLALPSGADLGQFRYSADQPSGWLPNNPYPDVKGKVFHDYVHNNENAALIANPNSHTPTERGTHLIDLNGDGLVDALRSSYEYKRHYIWRGRGGNYFHRYDFTHSAWLNTAKESSGESSRWQIDDGDYFLPVSLQSNSHLNQKVSSIADLNGDGLVDVLFSRDDSIYLGPDGQRALTSSDYLNGTNNGGFINTGTGWQEDTSWGLPDGIHLGKSGTTQGAAIVADMNGDGFPDVIGKILTGQHPELWLNNCRPEVITSFTDGFGSQLEVEYHRLNDPSPTPGFGTRVFEKFSGTLATGQAAVIDSRLVVSRYSEPDGLGVRKWKSQRYGDLLYDRTNETTLGFGWIEACDESNGQLTRTVNSQVFPYAGSPLYTETSVYLSGADIASMPPNHAGCPSFTEGRKVLTSETAAYAEMPTQAGTGGLIRRPVQTSSVKHLYDLDGTLKGETVTTQALADFDAYGFVTKSTVTSLDGTSVLTQNTFTHNTTGGKWHLGRLSAATVTKSRSVFDTTVKTSAFSYDSTTGLLKSETVEPSSPLSVTTNYTHDAFGNVTTTAVTADAGSTSGGVQTRTATSVYDSRGRFVTSEVNSLGHTVSYAYDTQKALLLSTTDIGGLTTYFTYDSFGTQILTHHPDGTKTAEITGYASNASVPELPLASLLPGHTIRYFRAKQASGTPPAKVYLDALGRELVTETVTLLNGASTSSARYGKVYTITQYDTQGRKIAVSEPFLPGEAINYTTISYDLLSRVTQTIRPGGECDCVLEQGSCPLNGQPTTYSKTENSAHQILERWEDQHGRLVQSKDPSGQTTTFSYDLEGRMTSVAVGNESLLTNIYDQLGNKTGVMETNSGYSQSQYNGFGEMVSSTNAKGQTTTYSFDSLGRPVSVTKPEGTYATTYSNASGASLGKPLSISGPSGYLETFTYDSLGRTTATSKTQFGETFTTSTVYDALGRIASSTDAGGLTVFTEYDPTYSFPLRQKLAPGSYEGAGTVLWQAGTYDSKGRALTQTLAQGVTISSTYDQARGDLTGMTSSWSGGTLQDKGYQWDSMGNLLSRTDNVSKRLESFTYDNLNRLSGSTVASLPGATITTVPPPQSYSYDVRGNLLTKGSSATLTYGDPSRVHGVSSAIVKGFSRTYTYDAAGYVVSDSKRTYEWTSFGQLKKLEYAAAPDLKDISGNIVHAGGFVKTEFEFDAGGNRARQIKERTAPNDSRVIENTTYLGSYERENHSTKTNGNASSVPVKTIHRHSLGGGMIYTKTIGGTAAGVRLTNVLKDHLGSTDVVFVGKWNTSTSSFVHESTERQSFDAWAERRDDATQVNYRSTDTDSFRTSGNNYDRGYTGHEQLDDSGLIHMNGRIYDPELGRFLSPDPVVQIPEYSQNFNRYSYVLNNPLNATDPSGFSFLGKVFGKVGKWIKENWRTIVVIVVVAIVTWGVGAAFIGAAGATGTTFATAGSSLTAAGLAATGAIAGAVGGGLSAALAGGDLGDILRSAAIGGIQGAMTGGLGNNVGSAFQAGNYAAAAAYAAGHGILGGTVNVAMGGKFGDGFIIAASSAAAQAIPYGNGNGVAATIKAGAVGGTASALGGGKFANGAYTGAFQYLVTVGLSSLNSGQTVGSYSTEEAQAIAASQNSYNDNNGGIIRQFIPTYSESWGFSATMSGSAATGYTVAFRGTQLASLADWYNNILQAFGIPTPQYTMAKALARSIYDQTGGNVRFVGHSLGGGLASAAAMVTGARAITINAAGLHPWTASGGSPKVSALFIKGDILSFGQDFSLLPKAYGQRSGFNPPRGASPIGYHGSDMF